MKSKLKKDPLDSDESTIEYPKINNILCALKTADYDGVRQLILSDKSQVHQRYGNAGSTLLHLCVLLLGTHHNTEHSEKNQELFDLIQLLLEEEANPLSELDLPSKERPIDILYLKFTTDHFSELCQSKLAKSLYDIFKPKDTLVKALCLNRNDFFRTTKGEEMFSELCVNFTYVFFELNT